MMQAEQQKEKGDTVTILKGRAAGKGKAAEGLGALGTDISSSF